MTININEMDVRAGVLPQSVDDDAAPGLQIFFQDHVFHFGLGFSWFDKRCPVITIVVLIALPHAFHVVYFLPDMQFVISERG
jgi:hypothetical protein